MSVYARSDVVHVAISRDHGGCGKSHSRPVIEGAPVKIWKLDCAECEDQLRSDSLWSSTISEIPETPDEVSVREDQQRRGEREQADATAQALMKLSHLGDLPSVLARLLTQTPGALEQAGEIDSLCRNGHSNPAANRFCSRCGVAVDEPVRSNRGPELSWAPSMEEDVPGVTGAVEETKDGPLEAEPVDLESMSMAELKEMAEQLGVKATRSKADQIQLIQDHLEK